MFMSSPPGNFDPQTLADRQAQRCIVENLRAIYGSQLRIVGEEGEGGAMGGFFNPRLGMAWGQPARRMTFLGYLDMM